MPISYKIDPADPATFRRFWLLQAEARDLYPAYDVAIRAGFDRAKTERWLISYWCFGDSGSAAVGCEPEDEAEFWAGLHRMAETTEARRSKSRRNFWGAHSRGCIDFLRGRGLGPIFDELRGMTGQPSGRFVSLIWPWPMFGRYTTVKAVEMIDALGVSAVDFRADDLSRVMAGSPSKGAEAYWRACHPGDTPPDAKTTNRWALERVTAVTGDVRAVCGRRNVGPGDAESMLCEAHGNMRGRYNVGDNATGVRRQLLRVARNRTAQTLLRAGNDVVW